MGHYHIVNWATHHENSRSRQIRNITWVPVPNKHDGEGFLRIMEQPDGMTIYAAWHLILQVASKCHPRGTLVRDDGTALTPAAIALKARATEADITRAIEVLVSPEVNWLEEVSAFEPNGEHVGTGSGCQEGGGQVVPGCQEGDGCPSQKGTERKGTEGKGTEGNWSSTSVDHKDSSPGRASEGDAEFWARVSDRVTRSLDKLTPPRKPSLQPKTPLDWSLIYKVCAIVERDFLPENWLTSSINATRDSKVKQENPWAYFQACLTNQAREHGKLLAPMLGLQVPAELLDSATGPDRRMET